MALHVEEVERKRKAEQKEAEYMKRKLSKGRRVQKPVFPIKNLKIELQETRSSLQNADLQSEIHKLRSELVLVEEKNMQQKKLIEHLQGTISQQREDYNLHLQAALELATSPEGISDILAGNSFVTQNQGQEQTEKGALRPQNNINQPVGMAKGINKGKLNFPRNSFPPNGNKLLNEKENRNNFKNNQKEEKNSASPAVISPLKKMGIFNEISKSPPKTITSNVPFNMGLHDYKSPKKTISSLLPTTPSSNLKKDLALIDQEIDALQKSLERATTRLGEYGK